MSEECKKCGNAYKFPVYKRDNLIPNYQYPICPHCGVDVNE